MVNAAVVVMSAGPFLSLMLYPTFCRVQLFPKMLGVEDDFLLANFQFLRCNVALSYLV